jgi:hypothetical protein
MLEVHFAKVLSHPRTAELVGIDVRALAAGRIGLALILPNQVIYEWSSSGPERFSTYLESIRAFAHEVSDDPTILQDMLRGAGRDESFLNE